MIRQTITLVLTVAFAAACVFSTDVRSQDLLPTDPVAEAIRVRIESAGQPAKLKIGDQVIYASRMLPQFYERRGFTPAWSHDGAFLPAAQTMLDAVSGIKAQGLRPNDYHFFALTELLAEINPTPARLAEADILWTDTFLVLATHIVSGRVDPATFEQDWIATRPEVNLVERLERVFPTSEVQAEPLAKILEGLRPQHAAYQALLNGLARYRRIVASGGWPSLGEGTKLEAGMQNAMIPKLRQRLTITGDHDGSAPEDPLTFDSTLAQSVARFQSRHGLEDDGVIGPLTREALNVSAERRVRQIELNLERWRWLPQDLGPRYILVNVPEFQLRLYEDGAEALSMRVVAGRAARKTPVFSDTMRYLVFSPSWDVPPTILRQDKLPALKRNPAVASEQGFRVFQASGSGWVEVNASAVDWSKATPANTRLRQRPGAKNALGRVKFMFPNPFNVYLHDTPSRALFSKAARDFSSGCIRLEKPFDLATYLLREDPVWTPEAVRAAMESGQERSVTLPKPMPVHIQYWTAFVGDDGTMQFRRDIYGRDAKLDAALKLPPPVESDPDPFETQ